MTKVERQFRVGSRIKVNMGINNGRVATVIPSSRIKTNGRGIPDIGCGHYKPISRLDGDVAIAFDDGTLDVYNSVHLTLREGRERCQESSSTQAASS